MRQILFTLLALNYLLCLLVPSQAQKNKTAPLIWTPELAIDHKEIAVVKVSPNGQYTIIAYRDKDKDLKESIKFSILSNKDNKVLFSAPQGEEYLEAEWSPDGEWIAYLKMREETNSLGIIDTKNFHPISIYSIPSHIALEDLKWSPNGKNIAFITRISDKGNIPSAYKFRGSEFITDSDYSKEYSRIAIISVDLKNKIGSTPSFVTPPSLVLTNARENRIAYSPYSWSPDSLRIAFSYSNMNDDQKFFQDSGTKVAIVDIKTGKIKELNQPYSALNPFFSPDGKQLAFVTIAPSPNSQMKTPHTMIAPLDVCLLDLKTNQQRCLATTPNQAPQIIGWTSDASSVIVTDTERVKTALYALSVSGKDITKLSVGKLSSLNFFNMNSSGTHIGFVGESLFLPPEGYILALKDFSLMQLTNFHKHLDDLPRFKTEVVTWPSFDGKEIEGILTYPAGYKKGTPVPLVVLTHGGPPTTWLENFIGFSFGTPPSPALYATQGFAVLKPNLRGSDGYGPEFRELNYKDWGPGPFKDIMSGVDYLITKGMADPERLVLGGCSYGGYITTFAITQTNRFKAALVQAGVTDLISHGMNSAMFSYFGGNFWEDYPTWLENSPIMHVEKINTPTLIQHGRQDFNVNIDQSLELYTALHMRKVPVKMIAYLTQGHSLEDKAAIIATKATFKWLDQYVNKNPKESKSKP